MVMHDGRPIASDVVVGSAAGYGATMAMEYFNSFVYEHVESEAARRREQELREAMPTVVMARIVNDRLGGRLPEQRVDKLGEWAHFAFGVAWGPIYAALRRRTGIGPLKLGLGLGPFVSLAFDEGLTPAAVFSRPNRAFPWQTHARAFAAHLAFGLALASLVEGCWQAIPAHPEQRRQRRLLRFIKR